MVILLSLGPVPVGAATPATASESRMFDTEAGVRLVHPPQVLLKQLFDTALGAQESKNPAGKVVRLEQTNQAELKV